MQGPLNTLVIVSGASAAFTALVFSAMYVAFRTGLAGSSRKTATPDAEKEFAAPYFGRIN
jgi:hypothetical protein